MATSNANDETPSTATDESPKKSTKSKERTAEAGIIYLSKIPQYMSVKKIRQIFGHYGELDRVFLQPDDKVPSGKKGRLFGEGWVEFNDKKIAKRVALSLNNRQIGGKRRSKWHDQIWNIKYLNRFKWTHLNERLAYEKAVHQQRLRTEIAQVKRETNFHLQNMEKSQRLKRKEKREMNIKLSTGDSEGTSDRGNSVIIGDNESQTEIQGMRPFQIRQKETEEEILAKKRKRENLTDGGDEVKHRHASKGRQTWTTESKKCFLKHIFSGGLDAEDED